MIQEKSDGYFVSVNPSVSPLGIQHMKIASQGDVALGRRNVLSLYDPLPLTVTDSVFSFKINVSNQSRRSLHTVAVVKP